MNQINEASTCTFRVRFFDLNDEPIIPTTVHYRLWDQTNDRLVRDWTSVTAADTVDVEIAATDHEIYDDEVKLQRHLLTVQANRGLSTQVSAEQAYRVKNLSAFT